MTTTGLFVLKIWSKFALNTVEIIFKTDYFYCIFVRPQLSAHIWCKNVRPKTMWKRLLLGATIPRLEGLSVPRIKKRNWTLSVIRHIIKHIAEVRMRLKLMRTKLTRIKLRHLKLTRIKLIRIKLIRIKLTIGWAKMSLRTNLWKQVIGQILW